MAGLPDEAVLSTELSGGKRKEMRLDHMSQPELRNAPIKSRLWHLYNDMTRKGDQALQPLKSDRPDPNIGLTSTRYDADRQITVTKPHERNSRRTHLRQELLSVIQDVHSPKLAFRGRGLLQYK